MKAVGGLSNEVPQNFQRTGRKSITSLKSYSTTLGDKGHMQEAFIFNSSNSYKELTLSVTN